MTYMTCDPTVEEGTSTVAYYYIKLRKETEIRNNEKKKNSEWTSQEKKIPNPK
mgnify:CR=1 FL=1